MGSILVGIIIAVITELDILVARLKIVFATKFCIKLKPLLT